MKRSIRRDEIHRHRRSSADDDRRAIRRTQHIGRDRRGEAIKTDLLRLVHLHIDRQIAMREKCDIVGTAKLLDPGSQPLGTGAIDA